MRKFGAICWQWEKKIGLFANSTLEVDVIEEIKLKLVEMWTNFTISNTLFWEIIFFKFLLIVTILTLLVEYIIVIHNGIVRLMRRKYSIVRYIDH